MPVADRPDPSARRSGWSGRVSSEAGIAPDELLDIDGDTVGIRIDARIDLDVTRFEACLADDACGAEAAIEIYHGDLLEGLGHDCFAAERERLSDRYEDALAIVAERRLEACDLVGARAAADRLLERDLLREEAHAVLIAVHGQIGSRSQVVRQHRRLQDVLRRELGEAPLPDTEAIYRQALDNTMRRALERAARARARASPGPGRRRATDVAGYDAGPPAMPAGLDSKRCCGRRGAPARIGSTGLTMHPA